MLSLKPNLIHRMMMLFGICCVVQTKPPLSSVTTKIGDATNGVTATRLNPVTFRDLTIDQRRHITRVRRRRRWATALMSSLPAPLTLCLSARGGWQAAALKQLLFADADEKLLGDYDAKVPTCFAGIISSGTMDTLSWAFWQMIKRSRKNWTRKHTGGFISAKTWMT